MIQAFYSAAVGAQQQMQKMNVRQTIRQCQYLRVQGRKASLSGADVRHGQWDWRGSASEGERDAHGIHRDRLQSGTC